MYGDTIAAIATAPGEGGIGVVRLSGPEAAAVAGRVFRRAGRGEARVARFPSHRLIYGAIVDPDSGATLDEALAVRMAPPRTYTREEVVELQCHGGAVATREVLRACLRAGARAAEPGEFTLRAFVNGRLDLAQAEAVLGVVTARTPESLQVAVAGLRGRLGGELRPARDALVAALAYLDASADFPEDERPADVAADLAEAARRLDDLARRAAVGTLYREGVQVAIVGRPNVGKSSLLNALLRQERAIVTPVAGTTRDVIAESITLRGIPVALLDTAGIADTADQIEQLGIARSRAALTSAALVLFVLDASAPPTADDLAVAAALRDRLGADDAGRSVLIALNKADRFGPAGPAPQEAVAALLPAARRLPLSAQTGDGLAALEAALHDLAVGAAGGLSAASDPALATTRQRETIARARDHARHAAEALAAGVPLDLVAVDARAALVALGEITGETASEAILEAIFSRFCIGK